jgi:hypothetical protein
MPVAACLESASTVIYNLIRMTCEIQRVQSSLYHVKPKHRIDRYGLTIALDPRTEFVEVFRAGLFGDAPQSPHINLVV